MEIKRSDLSLKTIFVFNSRAPHGIARNLPADRAEHVDAPEAGAPRPRHELGTMADNSLFVTPLLSKTLISKSHKASTRGGLKREFIRHYPYHERVPCGEQPLKRVQPRHHGKVRRRRLAVEVQVDI